MPRLVGSGLYLEQARAANKKTFAGSGKGLARNVGFVASTTGDFSRIDGRAVVAVSLPKLLPFGGCPGFYTRTPKLYSPLDETQYGPTLTAITLSNRGNYILPDASTIRSIGIIKLHCCCGARWT